MKRKVAVLGSTGSVGRNALAVAESMPDIVEITGLTANRNLRLFKKQLERWRPKMAAVHDEESCGKLKGSLDLPGTDLLAGPGGVAEVASFSGADVVICAISGSPALAPLHEAIKAGKLIGLASKEPIVMTGRLLMDEAARRGAQIIPVDSEPNAIFQCLKANNPKQVRNLIITASGGPFYRLETKLLRKVTKEDALSHPAWSMGRKISIDSATMMNKGLEVLEACNLFDMPLEKIKVLIHPEAKIHSMVEFIDGNIMAVISRTDMRVPIQYAVTYPERMPTSLKPLDLAETSRLTFSPPEAKKFPGLGYCLEAGRTGGTMPAVLNGANEAAVEAFLGGKIRFIDIASLCRKVMDSHKAEPLSTIAEAVEADAWARKKAGELAEKWN